MFVVLFSILTFKYLILCIAIKFYLMQIWIFDRMSGMQKEIDQLKSDVGHMKKNIGFDDELFDDLSDFDKKVSYES